jgi:phage terminase small subunit
MRDQKLSAKRQRFVEEYLVDLNGAQAAIRAGYSPTTAKVTASRLLTDDNVAAAVAALRAKLSKKLEATAERVIAELALLGFSNLADFYRKDAAGNLVVNADALLDRAKAAAVAQLDLVTAADGTQTIKLKLADKKSALVELGKHLGLFGERAEIAPPQLETTAPPDDRRLAMMILAILREATSNADPVLELVHDRQRPASSAAFTSETAKLEMLEHRRIDRADWQKADEAEPLDFNFDD